MREIQGIGTEDFERALHEGKIESGQGSRVLVEIMTDFVIAFDFFVDGRLILPYHPSAFEDLDGENEKILTNRRWLWVSKDNPKRGLVSASDSKVIKSVFG